jgi:putative intracellular protease/amidase
MRIGFVIYPRFTALDAVGPYEVLSRIGGEVVWTAPEAGPVETDAGATLVAGVSLDDCPELDVLLVPGGPGQEDLMDDEGVLGFLRERSASAEWTTSVCTGSLLLGAAGLLEGRRAVTHWLAMERLREFGAEPVHERVVEDGNVITAAGVSAGIDMGLLLAGRLRGRETAEAIQLGIEYDPSPPHDSGSPTKARPELVEALRQASRHILQGSA